MPHATTNDGVRLYYEEAGIGPTIVFVHEFAGDHRSWEPQLRFFSRRYRCVAFNARGYPPSDVPDSVEKYSQARARDDVIAILDHLGVETAHVVGLSMGGFATLHVGLAYPQRCRSLVIGGCGYGSHPGEEDRFRAESEATAKLFETQGSPAAGAKYGVGPVQTDEQGHPQRMSLNRVKGFRSKEIARWSRCRLAPGTAVHSDGLACFGAVSAAGCTHTPTVMSGPGLARRRHALNWVDTMLGNVKNAIHGTYHAIRSKHLPRYLAEFSYRFNRRYDLAAMLARLATAAAQTPPMPYRLVKLAEAHW